MTNPIGFASHFVFKHPPKIKSLFSELLTQNLDSLIIPNSWLREILPIDRSIEAWAPSDNTVFILLAKLISIYNTKNIYYKNYFYEDLPKLLKQNEIVIDLYTISTELDVTEETIENALSCLIHNKIIKIVTKPLEKEEIISRMEPIFINMNFKLLKEITYRVSEKSPKDRFMEILQKEEKERNKK